MNDATPDDDSAWARLKRRKLVQWALAYLAGAWVLLQVAGLIGQQFDWPPALLRGLTVAAGVGFFVTLVLAWYHGERGVQRVSATELMILALVLAIGGGLLWRFAEKGPVENGPGSFSGPTVDASGRGSAPDLDPFSIAVLPFVDMSQAQDQEYFSDGLSEELLNLLAQLPQLRVIARTSSFSFKGKGADVATIAKALGVAHVLEGSVRKSGNTLRVTAQLIRADDSSHLWSQSYDRELTDVFQVQDEIAGEVVAALKVRLLPEQALTNTHRGANVEAYNQYLLGNSFFERATYENWQRAIPAYRQAIALDPGYAAAYAALARVEAAAADYMGDASGMERALAAADKSIALAPDMVDGYLSRGTTRLAHTRDWRGAQDDYEKALALAPGHSGLHVAYGRLMIALGRMPDAIATTRKATALDPLSSNAWVQLGRLLNASADYPAARQALDRALAIAPESVRAHFHRGMNSQFTGKLEEALADYRQAGAYENPGVAMVEHTLGRPTESQRALDKAIAGFAQGGAYQIADVYAWRGEKDKAFEWLDRAVAQRDGGLSYIQIDPLVASLRDDARYKVLLEKMGLPH